MRLSEKLSWHEFGMFFFACMHLLLTIERIPCFQTTRIFDKKNFELLAKIHF